MRRIIGAIGATLAVVAAVAVAATPASAGGHTSGANFGMADGSVRFISYSTSSYPILGALGSRAGGEVVSSDW